MRIIYANMFHASIIVCMFTAHGLGKEKQIVLYTYTVRNESEMS